MLMHGNFYFEVTYKKIYICMIKKQESSISLTKYALAILKLQLNLYYASEIDQE